MKPVFRKKLTYKIIVKELKVLKVLFSSFVTK